MATSRIFVKGLPPTISEDEFKKHFSAKQSITDAKLIPHRRIGYVGYKSPEDAAKAVKYFNRSFIRMSKIGVEIARPISDTTLPASRKVQREHAKETQRLEKAAAAAVSAESPSLKRKRGAVDEQDPKLKEFLEVMLPKSNAKAWGGEGPQDHDVDEPPTKMQAIEIPEAESDEEYEIVPKKQRKDHISPKPETPPAVSITSTVALPIESEQPLEEALEPVAPGVGASADATDDDWLRSRTNRLLDLVDPNELAVSNPAEAAAEALSKAANILQQTTKRVDAEVEGSHDVIDQETPQAEEVIETEDPTMEAIRSNGRLFVRNLPYTATEEDLRHHFETYGILEEVHLPLDAAGTSKGFVLVQFEDPNAAAEAFHNLDGEPFQGRLLHILPAAAKRENKIDEFALAKLPLKKQKQIKKKAEASTTTFNWNSLYMNQDAVNSSIADRLGVSKSELFDPTSADAGVKQAIAETSIIQETKSYFAKNGVDLNAFKKRERGDTAILVKNFPYGMSTEEVRKLFEEFGQVLRVLMPPTGTIAIVEFAQPPQARAAFASLAYRRMKDSVLFLEKAPKDLFTHASSNVVIEASSKHEKRSTDPKLSAEDLLARENADVDVGTSTLFVRNLSFNTTSSRLTEVFKPLAGFMSARVNTKTDPKKPGQVLSMGFGFLEFKTKTQAQAALAAMDGYNLDDHSISIKASHKGSF